MSSSPSNPSRYAEEVAVEFVKRIVGSLGSVIHVGESHGPDFRIQYHDGRRGIGEVKLDMDPGRRAAWVALTSRELPQRIRLAPKSGAWSVSTTPDPYVRLLDQELPHLVAELIKLELPMLDEYTWPRPSLFEECLKAGVTRLTLIDKSGIDEAVIFPQGWSGMVPLDANSAVPWIESFFAPEHRYQKSWMRLQEAPDTEKHAFIWISDASPNDLQMRVSFHPETAPTLMPRLPQWLTHLWIGITGTFAAKPCIWLYEPGLEWQVHEFD